MIDPDLPVAFEETIGPGPSVNSRKISEGDILKSSFAGSFTKQQGTTLMIHI